MELEHVPSRNHSHGAGKLNQSLLTPSEVARWLGVSAGWVRDHATRKGWMRWLDAPGSFWSL